jgi:hypothetical protein
MNERIKQLAEQYKDEIRDAFDGYDVVHWCNVENLIQDVVRECAEIVADAVDHREPASTYASKIKQHFGVKQ